MHSLGAGALLALTSALPAFAQSDLNDLQMAHVAVVADGIDIRYAHLALALSESAAVRLFAETMIRDHTSISAAVVALAKKLNVEAQDNPVSRKLLADAAGITTRLSKLRGAAFDRTYAANELAYHHAVNTLVEGTFIPRIKNAEVKQAFTGALVVFKEHEQHATMMVHDVTESQR